MKEKPNDTLKFEKQLINFVVCYPESVLQLQFLLQKL